MKREFDPELDSFDQFIIPFGKDSLSIQFAHLSLTFQTIDLKLKELINEMYKPFIPMDLTSVKGTHVFRPEPQRAGRKQAGAKISVVKAEAEAFLELTPGEVYRIEFSKKGSILFFWSYYFACRYDPEKKDGVLVICTGKKINLRQVIENFMRIIFSYIALYNGSFFLHSSGIVKDKKAHIFFGHSGAGKTTIVAFSKGLPLLSDDQVLVYLKEDKPYASGVPFSGGERFRQEEDAIKFSNVNEEFEVAGFYWLVKDKDTFLEPLPLIHAAAKLASAIPFIKDSPFPMQDALNLATEIAQRAKIFALHFRKDDSFLQII